MTDAEEMRELRFVVITDGVATSMRMLTTETRAGEFARQALAEAPEAASVEVWDGDRRLFSLGSSRASAGAGA